MVGSDLKISLSPQDVPRASPWSSGMYNPTHPSSRQCTYTIHLDTRQCTLYSVQLFNVITCHISSLIHFALMIWWLEGHNHSVSALSFHFHQGISNRGEIKILIFSTKMLSIQSAVPTKEPNKTTKTDTRPLMTKLHRIGHSCDCISNLYCIVSNTTQCYSKGKRA